MAKGGRMASKEYGRPAQAKGVGKNAKRHDLERPKTPGLHGSDLQQGDVQALEQGQRIAPAATQDPAAPEIARQTRTISPNGDETSSMQIPDAIDFLAERNGDRFEMPEVQRRIDASKAMTWLPILRQLAGGPGASSALVNAFINQARKMQQAGGQPATVVDMHAADDGIEAMLESFNQQLASPVPMPTGEADPLTEGPGQPGLGRQDAKGYRPEGPGTA